MLMFMLNFLPVLNWMSNVFSITIERRWDISPDSGDMSVDSGVDLNHLVFPDAMVHLYEITCRAHAGSIYLLDGFEKGQFMDEDGEPCRLDEHWLRFGLVGDDHLLVSLTSGDVVFSDQYYWRYDESDSSRVLAPDVLTFFNDYAVGPKYSDLGPSYHREGPSGWLHLLDTIGFCNREGIHDGGPSECEI
ncbi:hypothetical protein ACFV4K_13805 [Nocardia sp. NPDC059764]|uniref:hypothetical protein n=1 Tax=Nocardia sp. NPDC059764 TaxID=3346939 RepID=UPI003650C702